MCMCVCARNYDDELLNKTLRLKVIKKKIIN